MRLELYSVGVVGKQNGAGVVLCALDDHGRTRYRKLGFRLGANSVSQAEIQAARLALASVRAACRSWPAILFVTSNHVPTTLTQPAEGFLLTELHRWANYYSDLRVEVIPPGGQIMDLALTLAQRAADYDSDTLEELE